MARPDLMQGLYLINLAEAILWLSLGAFLLTRVLRRRTDTPRLAIFSAVILMFFGLSDLVEMKTGAWWDPWWLFLWKALCVAGLAAAGLLYLRLAGRWPFGGPRRNLRKKSLAKSFGRNLRQKA